MTRGFLTKLRRADSHFETRRSSLLRSRLFFCCWLIPCHHHFIWCFRRILLVILRSLIVGSESESIRTADWVARTSKNIFSGSERKTPDPSLAVGVKSNRDLNERFNWAAFGTRRWRSQQVERSYCEQSSTWLYQDPSVPLMLFSFCHNHRCYFHSMIQPWTTDPFVFCFRQRLTPCEQAQRLLFSAFSSLDESLRRFHESDISSISIRGKTFPADRFRFEPSFERFEHSSDWMIRVAWSG